MTRTTTPTSAPQIVSAVRNIAESKPVPPLLLLLEEVPSSESAYSS
eukprot:CAMPEP_0198254388 /NCGR_PEP_ID=MMETSP1447-20131203/4700_1 /TAXON_ID=420782 /ORGANISM="Chaetoceros dichaeta, Strain CCMP1751" /LENGTH=45 /DNA_ID= /DNA_START= /DNA_END= /DNA_ORIENTATION=